jgi:hypothetical protein
MELKLQLESENIGSGIKKKMDKLGQVVRDAMREAAGETADAILFRGAEDIADAGNFGDRWQEALHADIRETQRTVYVNAFMKADQPPVTFWKVFEYGATIKPKSATYLWLPFLKNNQTGVWPRAYPGELFFTTSKKGTPLAGDKEIAADEGPEGNAKWMYFGLDQVTIPKKFHLHEIVKDEAKNARAALQRILREMKG